MKAPLGRCSSRQLSARVKWLVLSLPWAHVFALTAARRDHLVIDDDFLDCCAVLVSASGKGTFIDIFRRPCKITIMRV